MQQLIGILREAVETHVAAEARERLHYFMPGQADDNSPAHRPLGPA